MKVTIGGDRLGSGGKMRTNLHGFQRSNHNLSRAWRSTMAPGTLVPFLVEPILNGDTFDIKLDTLVRTLPTNGPIFGSFKLQLDVFLAPMRLYNAQLHNNALGIGMDMSKVKFPKATLTVVNPDLSQNDLNSQQIHPSSLWSYLGVNGVGHGVNSTSTQKYLNRSFNAMPMLIYADIYKNYYSNKQEGVGYVISPTINIFDNSIATATLHKNGQTEDITNADRVAIYQGYIIRLDGENFSPNGFRVRLESESVDIDPRDIGFEISVNKARTGAELWYRNSLPRILVSKKQNGGVVFGVVVGSEENTEIEIKSFNLTDIDTMRETILAQPKATALNLGNSNTNGMPFYNAMVGYKNFTIEEKTMTENYQKYEMCGICVKTYQSDRFNNWLSTEWIEGANSIAEITKVDTSSGGFTMDALNLAQKVYDMLNRIAVSDGSYVAWQEAVYGEKVIRLPESPMYMGGMSTKIIFNEVVSTADATGAGIEQPLGTLAGRGTDHNGMKKGGYIRVKANEPSFVMGIVSITPIIDYSQGNKWFMNLETMNDLHKPSLDAIGFQDLITDEMAAFDTQISTTGVPTFYSAGKQPAWIEYMTSQNETHGNFALPNSEMFMTLNRRYSHDSSTGRIADLTTYIDPSKYNYAFAVQELKAQNFWVQIGIDIMARRKMSAKLIPNL